MSVSLEIALVKSTDDNGPLRAIGMIAPPEYIQPHSFMASLSCLRCNRPKPYLDESGLCEPCAEYTRLLMLEALRPLPLLCSHCGGTFNEKQFERHRWTCYYRDPSLVIKGRRQPR